MFVLVSPFYNDMAQFPCIIPSLHSLLTWVWSWFSILHLDVFFGSEAVWFWSYKVWFQSLQKMGIPKITLLGPIFALFFFLPCFLFPPVIFSFIIILGSSFTTVSTSPKWRELVLLEVLLVGPISSGLRCY